MKRRWWIALGIGVVGVVGMIFVLSVFFGDPINKESCDKINPGMTEAEVEKILGPPSDTKDMSAFNVKVKMTALDAAERIFIERRQKSEQTWKGRSATISVCFVEGGIAAYATLEQTEETFSQKIRRWLGLDPPVVSYPVPPFPVLPPESTPD